MDIGIISLVLLFGLLFLLAIGMPLGFASGFMAVVVLVMKFGADRLFSDFGAGILNILSQRMYGLASTQVLVSVPLFILMAALLERSGIARDMYDCLAKWLNRTRGGIAIATSLMAVVMAAMSGIVGGEVVLLGLIALPQMLRLGYDRNMAVGCICASGALGTMIPPSVVLIMYGLVTETSIYALFKGAFVPGFLLAGCYIVYLMVRSRIHPHLAPLPPPSADDLAPTQKWCYGGVIIAAIVLGWLALSGVRAAWATVDPTAAAASAVDAAAVLPSTMLQIASVIIAAGVLYALRAHAAAAWRASKGMLAPGFVVFIVLGSIYGGITSITEAAAMGVVAVVVLIISRGEFSLDLLRTSLLRTFKSTGVIMWVTFGATALAGAYTIVGGPTYVAGLIADAQLPTLGVLATMMLLLLFLGAFMDWVGIVLLVMPVFLPIVLNLPPDEIGIFGPLADAPSFIPIWFGILFCVNMQVSFLSPPFGPAAFYLKSVAPPEISLPDIFRGFLPFILMQVFVLALVLLFPELAMFFR